jgi:hypothetical protein
VDRTARFWYADGTMALHRFRGVRYEERKVAERAGAEFDTKIPASLVRVVMDEAWVTLPIGEWIVACRLVMQGNQPVIGEVRVFPKDPGAWGEGGITLDSQFDMKVPLRWNAELLGLRAHNVPAGGITRTFLRDIPLGAAKKEIGKYVNLARQNPQLRAFFELFAQAMGPAFEPPRTRRGKPDLYYARLAQEYVDRVNNGSRHPVKDLATRHHKDVSRMRDMIREARERGLLGKVKNAVPGGQLTPYAIESLQGRQTQGEHKQRKKKGGHRGR